MTNYLESGLLGHLFKKQSFPSPDVLLCGLITDASNEASLEGGTATLAMDKLAISGGLSWSDPFESGSAYAVRNIVDITFPVASGNKGYVSGVGLYIGSSMIFYGSLTNAREIRDKDQFVFPSGSLKITFN